jgi:CAAX protease family protein
MTNDPRPDDADDIPTLRPLLPADSGDDLRIEYADYGEPPPPPRPPLPPPDPGFGFWMAVVWCVLFLLVTQVLAGVFCGVPIVLLAIAIEAAQNGPGAVNNEAGLKAWIDGPAGRLAFMGALLSSHLAGLLFGWLILRWRCGRKRWKRRIALTRGPTRTHAALVLIGLPAVVALSLAIEQPIMKYVPSIQDLLVRAHIDFQWPGIEIVEPLLRKTPWPLAIFAVAVVGPLNEEFWCRGFLGQGLSAQYRNWAVVLIVSFLFGAIHLEPRQGLNAMLLGVAIHGAYLATRSLWVAIFIHFAFNGVAVVHLNERLYPVLDPFEHALQDEPVLFVLSAALLFLGVGFALYQTRCKLVPGTPGMPVWEPPDAAGVELPPPGSGTVVTHNPPDPISVSLVLVGAIAFGVVLAAYG